MVLNILYLKGAFVNLVYSMILMFDNFRNDNIAETFLGLNILENLYLSAQLQICITFSIKTAEMYCVQTIMYTLKSLLIENLY